MNLTQASASSILERAKAVAAEKHKLDVLDTQKNYSYGRQSGTLNLVDEHAKALQVNLSIKNLTANMHTVAIAGLTSTLNLTQFASSSALATAVSATAVLANGKMVDDGSGKELTASLTDSGLNLDQLLKYIATNPTRLIGMSMVSRNASTLAGESTNYDLKLKTHWCSPFDAKPETKELNLRPLIPTGANFTQERLNVNFIEQAFPVILSHEHVMTLQINSGTELMITLFIGAQDSAAQRFWRNIKAADDVIRPELLKK